MKRTISVFVQIAVALAFVLLITPSAEAASRTWISGASGNDANPCTRASPCATFAHALTVTDAFGEINCIDPVSNPGEVFITKSITISCEGGTAGLLGNSDGFDINVAATDTVYLKGLDIEGLGPSNAGGAGIFFEGSGTLHVEKCRIHGFVDTSAVGFGILFDPNGSASLYVSDTTIADNGATGIGGNLKIATGSSGGLVNVVLKNVRMLGGGFGLLVSNNGTTTIHVDVEDTLASGSTGDGFQATTPGGRLTMMIAHSVASNNALVGVEADGSNTELHIDNSRVFGNGTGVVGASGATFRSYSNNEIDLNGHNGTPLSQAGLN